MLFGFIIICRVLCLFLSFIRCSCFDYCKSWRFFTTFLGMTISKRVQWTFKPICLLKRSLKLAPSSPRPSSCLLCSVKITSSKASAYTTVAHKYSCIQSFEENMISCICATKRSNFVFSKSQKLYIALFFDLYNCQIPVVHGKIPISSETSAHPNKFCQKKSAVSVMPELCQHCHHLLSTPTSYWYRKTLSFSEILFPFQHSLT